MIYIEISDLSVKRINSIISIFLASFMLFALAGTANASYPINNVNVSAIKTNSAIISWDSTIAGTSQIEYGTTVSYGNITPEDSLAYFHTTEITSLSGGVLYHYRI